MDGNLAVNTTDLTKFLGVFGTSCPSARPGGDPESALRIAKAGSTTANASGASNMTSNAPTPPGPVITALGFSSREAYFAYVNGLTQEATWEHIVHVIEVIQQLGLD